MTHFTTHRLLALCPLLVLALFLFCSDRALAQVAAVPNSLNFQGRLAKPDGTPVANGNYSLRFSLWNLASGGTAAVNEKWNQTIAGVPVRNGTFAVLLNVSTGAADKFNGNLWLEIKVGADAALTPRTPLVTVPYAFKAGSVVDGAITGASIANGTLSSADFPANFFNNTAWLLGGNSATNPATQFLGTTDSQPLQLRVNNYRALRISYVENLPAAFRTFNMLGGANSNNIGANVVGATIAGGGNAGINSTDLPNSVNSDYGFLGGGYYNLIDTNAVNSVIGGGFQNNINPGASNSAIVGGENNIVSAAYAFIGGGSSNRASGANAFVGGGVLSGAGGANSVVVGGNNNLASAQYAAVLGGNSNIASEVSAFIGGGSSNRAGGISASVGGGKLNKATADQTTVGGGESNEASWAAYATIGGGVGNIASNASTVVAGGARNIASGPVSAIGGGSGNQVYGRNSTIAGGYNNASSNDYSAVGGGYNNLANGLYSTIPGGYQNYTSGLGSFAAGIRASANYTGSFVWADNHDVDFASTAANQFAIRAYGGMILETGQNAYMYTSATVGEKNRYFLLLNSPQTVSASGLKTGGILCADDYSYANPGKNDMAVKGTLGVGYPNPSPYRFAVNGTTYSLGGYSSSDARWKTDVRTLPDALDAILGLRGVSFDWKPTEGMNFPEGRQIGFVAQEVEKVLPELVSTDSKGYKSVAYQNVVPVLVEAVKQQQKQIAAQQKQIVALSRESQALRAKAEEADTLKARLSAIEATLATLKNHPK